MATSKFSRARAALTFTGPEGLTSSHDVFRLMAARTPVGIFVASPSGQYEYVNESWCELAGISAEQALGSGWESALHPEDADRVIVAWERVVTTGEDGSEEYRFLKNDGSASRVETHVTAMRDDTGGLIGWVGTCLDLTNSRIVEDNGTPETDRYKVAFDNAPIGMGLVTPEGTWLQVNRAFCRLLGYSEEELLELRLADLTVPGDTSVQVDEVDETRHETRYLRSDGTPIWVAASTTLVRTEKGEPLYYVLQVEDIGDRKQTERELRRLADHDALTGLLNRRGFMDGLRRELRRMERKGEYGALLLLDLDNFKLVNDNAGHLAGDQVLRTTADVLRRRLRATDVIGRLGGDEFAALVLNVTPRQAGEIAAETTETLRAMTVTAGDVTIEVAASIGVVAIDELHGENEDELLAAADRAMYRVKSLRRDG
ncbi:MAG TPA: PAS domain S-box protein [Gaiellaceae bacterium]|jgi:diguanylate cyclase (GGDEF)-like protein/PAS domain S-box-containing protein|nr:PAS domain S-box protein [Gaiellaceae bacterium]